MSYRNSLQQLSEEEEYRKAIWEENKLKIEAHNKEAEQGKHSYRLGMNFLGDMTSKEMAEKMTYLGKHPSNHAKSSGGKCQTTRFFNVTLGPPQCMKDFGDTLQTKLGGSCYMTAESPHCMKGKDMATEEKVDTMSCPLKPPKSIDYRKRGMVTRVKNQGDCNACWAFSAAGALEGQLAKKTGQLVDLSVQNLVDCVTESDGCNGGLMTHAFKYVQDNGGINSEEAYPFTGKKQRCHHNLSAIAAQCKGFNEVSEGDECALAKALHEVGPVSVAIHSSNYKFMLYESGVYFNPECDKIKVDHAMLLVGYGETAEGQKYWIVKNSYGESWGEEGYLWIARDCGNHCGIASDASYPLMRDEI